MKLEELEKESKERLWKMFDECRRTLSLEYSDELWMNVREDNISRNQLAYMLYELGIWGWEIEIGKPKKIIEFESLEELELRLAIGGN